MVLVEAEMAEWQAAGRTRGGENNSRASIGQSHQPWLDGLLFPLDISNAGAQSEAFKCFCPRMSAIAHFFFSDQGRTMKDNCDEENYKVAARGDT